MQVQHSGLPSPDHPTKKYQVRHIIIQGDPRKKHWSVCHMCFYFLSVMSFVVICQHLKANFAFLTLPPPLQCFAEGWCRPSATPVLSATSYWHILRKS